VKQSKYLENLASICLQHIMPNARRGKGKSALVISQNYKRLLKAELPAPL
jgi:hypothetical protein